MIKKVKKILMSVIAAIMLLPMKITNAIRINPSDMVSIEALYGPPKEDTSTTIWDILKIAIIPIILISGLIIYLKKRKKKTKEEVTTTVKKNRNKTDEKIVTIIAIILLAVAIGLIIYNFLTN